MASALCFSDFGLGGGQLVHMVAPYRYPYSSLENVWLQLPLRAAVKATD